MVLLTGATGKIGKLLAAELLRQNFKVRILVRKGSSSALSHRLPSDAEIFRGDIRDFSSVSKAVEGVSLVFHLAALLHVNLPDPSMDLDYHNINVLGTWNILKASLYHGVQRVVFFSTVAVYGNSVYGETFCEESRINPTTPYAVTKAGAEQLAIGVNDMLKSKDRFPLVTILRLSSVYGPGVTGNYLKLIGAVRRGFFIIPADSRLNPAGALRSLINEEDVVRGAILAATHPEAPGKIYNLTDGHVHTLQDIVLSIAGAMDKKMILIKVPAKPFQLTVDKLDRFSSLNCLIPNKIAVFLGHVSHALDKLMENCPVNGSKIQRELGFKPKYNLNQGWHRAMLEMYD
ncbi:MAG: NAD-dependent epimerase/dehydratase family protein [Desulfamplus sp.]|nr:NAD-dependent epimerase/dehydratase family protein [Desulfamplus sp.]